MTPGPVYRYRARCVRATDGDTLRLDIDLGMRVHADQAIRVRGVDAPELNTVEGKAARVWLVDLMATHGESLIVETEQDHMTFNRYVADIHVVNLDRDLGELLLEAGHAVRWAR